MEEKMIIRCPKCNTEISVDDVLSEQIKNNVKNEIEKEIRSVAEKENESKLQILEEKLKQREKNIAEFREQEIKLRKEKDSLEEEKKNFEIEIQRKLDEEKTRIKNEAYKDFEEKNHLKIAEKDKIIEDLKKRMEEAQRQATQGSQQTQGEVFELQFEQMLKSEFPLDKIEPVAKGVNGCDVIQTVIDRNGRECGKIAWEMKNTKTWSGGWIPKLKEDQRQVKAVIAVLLTIALPDDIKTFCFKDGVWISKFDYAIGIATALRRNLIEVTNVRLLTVNKNEKMETLYNYLTGSEFRNRVEAIAEAFIMMKDELEKEKRLFAKNWAMREKQIEKVVNNTFGMYGDLQGLMGPALPEIKQLRIEEEADQQVLI